jgi:hypothetical protein
LIYDHSVVTISITFSTIAKNREKRKTYEKCTGPNQILEFILYIYIYLNKNGKIYWSEQSFTGLGPEDRRSS